MRHLVAVVVAVVAIAGTGCSTGTSAATGGRLPVVAAENIWGNLAAELGGNKVTVRSIIRRPGTDPHDYEPTAADARAVASARYVIVNGVGYDAWADRLLKANPADGRVVLNVGALVGVKAGGNPHLWYSPADVHKVVDRIKADYRRLSANVGNPPDVLARYDASVAGIRSKYGGVPVGASESIFTPMAEALGLKLVTPPAFLNAVSEGGEPTPADRATSEAQIRNRQIKVYVFNSQNATPDVRAQVDMAKRAGVRVVAITETPTPPSATFQDWQVRQLDALASALSR